MYNNDGDPISSDLMGIGDFMQRLMEYAVDGDYNALPGDDKLASAEAIIATIGEYNGWLQQQSIPGAINSKRVTIYTTWDTNNTAKVQLSNQ